MRRASSAVAGDRGPTSSKRSEAPGTDDSLWGAALKLSITSSPGRRFSHGVAGLSVRHRRIEPLAAQDHLNDLVRALLVRQALGVRPVLQYPARAQSSPSKASRRDFGRNPTA